jgi:hypothetical protein
MGQGYQRKKKIYKLIFADEEMNGLEVRCHSISIETMLELTALAGLAGKALSEFTTDDYDSVNTVFEAFSGALVSWNLEDEDGNPVPATLEGVKTQDLDFIDVIIKAWMERVAGISDPLARNSTAGQRSLEASIPMVTSSPSQLSSPRLNSSSESANDSTVFPAN